MHRSCWIALLFAGIAATSGGRGEASPLRLSIEGGGGIYAPFAEVTMAAGDRMPGVLISQPDSTELYTFESDDPIVTTIGSPFSYRAALKDATTGVELAELTLAGMIEGTETHWIPDSAPYRQVVKVSAVGDATASDLRLADGVTLAQLPSWFPRLTAHVTVGNDPAGPTGLEILSVLTVGAVAPEPGSTWVFLASAVGGLALLRNRGRSR